MKNYKKKFITWKDQTRVIIKVINKLKNLWYA